MDIIHIEIARYVELIGNSNTKGGGKIQEIERGEHWDTRDYPNGKYTVIILAWDAQNNKSRLPVDVTVNNSWLDYISNIIDEIRAFFFSS